jgi:purine-binding chemotaxis protein CheW
MDLGARLSLTPCEKTDRNVIIVVMLKDKMTGLLVDAVSDIIALTSQDLQPPPDMNSGGVPNVVSALTLIDDRLIRVLDLASVIAPSESAAA